jgi:predicted nucleic acid-binding protein
LPELDEGEAACIRFALQHGSDTGEAALLLMDERAGRAIAVDLGLRVAGTAAVIGMARLQGLIASAREVFAHLHASDFRISAEVIAMVLQRVGE